MPDHRYSAGDSLSQIASDHGLADWRRIWEDASNQVLRNLRGIPGNLEPGDIIHIPDRILAEVPGATERSHRFRRHGIPVAAVCFIDDQGNPTQDPRVIVNHLEISNFPTCPASVARRNSWELPRQWHRPSADRDNFKIEVEDRGEAGRDIPANRTVLEALKLSIDPSGMPVRGPNGQLMYESFNPPRTLEVPLRRIRNGANRFRSRYLRLVTDNEDKRARQNQTILIDHDPDDLNVEILDQILRVRYTSSSGETLRADIQVGRNQRRFKLRVYVLRRAPGSPDLVQHGQAITLDDIRRHVLCWVRRTYGSANMAPRLVSLAAIDPVENLISIFNPNRRTARGNGHIRFRLNTTPPTLFRYPAAGNIPANEAPSVTAQNIATMINNRLGPIWHATVFNNPVSFSRAQSSDILVTRADGRVIIDRERSTDGRTRIGIGRVNANVSTCPPVIWMNVGSRDHRTLIRNYRTDNNSIALFVIRRFRNTDGAVGFAYPSWFRAPAQFHTHVTVKGSVFVDVGTMDRRDRAVHTADHEVGHVLTSMVHFNGRHRELMTGDAVDVRNTWWGSKRISDELVRYRESVPGQPAVRTSVNPVVEVRSREVGYFDGRWR